MQPTAQAVGRQDEDNQPRRGERVRPTNLPPGRAKAPVHTWAVPT